MTDEPERTNMFYISARSQKGFTMDPAQAIVDLTGAPVIAPGYVRNILERQDRVYQRSLAVQQKAVSKIWDALLDVMEANIQYVDETAHIPGLSVAEMDVRMARMNGEKNGLQIALAILEYGHDYKQDPEATTRKVAEMAQVRYEQESE